MRKNILEKYERVIILIILISALVLGGYLKYRDGEQQSTTLSDYLPENRYAEPDKVRIIQKDNNILIDMSGFSDEYIDNFISECLNTTFPEMVMNRQHENIIEFKAYDTQHEICIELIGDTEKHMLSGKIKEE